MNNLIGSTAHRGVEEPFGDVVGGGVGGGALGSRSSAIGLSEQALNLAFRNLKRRRSRGFMSGTGGWGLPKCWWIEVEGPSSESRVSARMGLSKGSKASKPIRPTLKRGCYYPSYQNQPKSVRRAGLGSSLEGMDMSGSDATSMLFSTSSGATC